jgi:hypothetical protein
MCLAVSPMWGQWTGGSTGPIYYTGGSVGIGTSSPAELFEVNGGVSRFANTPTTSSHIDIYGGTDGSSTSSLYIYGSSSNAPNTYLGDGVYNGYINAHGGNLGVGTTSPQHLLHVAGTIGAEQIIVSSTGADYVFDPKYKLAPLSEVASYVEENHHLPGIPSADEMSKQGVSLGDMQTKLLAKIEELTLHMIELKQDNVSLQQQVQELRKQISHEDKP